MLKKIKYFLGVRQTDTICEKCIVGLKRLEDVRDHWHKEIQEHDALRQTHEIMKERLEIQIKDLKLELRSLKKHIKTLEDK